MPEDDDIDDAPAAQEPHSPDPRAVEPPPEAESDEAPAEAEPPVSPAPAPEPLRAPPRPAAPARPAAIRDEPSSPFRFFAFALVFALLAQPLAGGALLLLDRSSLVDFSAVDSSESTGALILGAVFILETMVVGIATARAGWTVGRAFSALTALGASLGTLMLFYVALGCWLYANCL